MNVLLRDVTCWPPGGATVHALNRKTYFLRWADRLLTGPVDRGSLPRIAKLASQSSSSGTDASTSSAAEHRDTQLLHHLLYKQSKLFDIATVHLEVIISAATN